MSTTAPLMISTWSFGQRGNRAAWNALAAGGGALDAVQGAATVIEEDPEVDSVGYGGLCDASGRVTLDASIMESPARCGSVCCVSRHLHVTALARAVMEQTPHVMLAGEGADAFAASLGFAERDLVSDTAREKWKAWRDDPTRGAVDQSRDSGLAARPIDTGAGGALFDHADDESRWRGGHDTIGVLALDSRGTLAGACSTSGLACKMPGRIGDSPIIGAGLYVDPEIGGAAATGSGELIMGICGAFLAVEMLRRGAQPVDALVEVLMRVDRGFTLRPEHQVALIALTRRGEIASAALRPGFKVAVRDPGRDAVSDPDITLRDD